MPKSSKERGFPPNPSIASAPFVRFASFFLSPKWKISALEEADWSGITVESPTLDSLRVSAHSAECLIKIKKSDQEISTPRNP